MVAAILTPRGKIRALQNVPGQGYKVMRFASIIVSDTLCVRSHFDREMQLSQHVQRLWSPDHPPEVRPRGISLLGRSLLERRDQLYDRLWLPLVPKVPAAGQPSCRGSHHDDPRRSVERG